MSNLDARYPTTINTLVVHLDVSFNILVINLALVLGHQASLSVSLLIPRLLYLTIQLLFILLHPLAEGFSLSRICLVLRYHPCTYIFSELPILEFTHPLVHVTLVDLEVKAISVGGLRPELIPLVCLLPQPRLLLLLSHSFEVLQLIALCKVGEIIIDHVISVGFHLELVLILVLAHLVEVLEPAFLIILIMLILDGGVHHVLLAETVTLAPLQGLLVAQILLIL